MDLFQVFLFLIAMIPLALSIAFHFKERAEGKMRSQDKLAMISRKAEADVSSKSIDELITLGNARYPSSSTKPGEDQKG